MSDSTRSGSARPAAFLDVSPPKPRAKPRWLSKGRTSAPPAGHERGSAIPPELRPSLRAAPVPKEFVRAVRRELRPMSGPEQAREIAVNEVIAEQMARSLRPSEVPGSIAAPPPPAFDMHAEALALERALRGAIEELARARMTMLEETAGQLAALAAVIARRVIARELELAPDILSGLVKEATDALNEQSELRVRVGRGFQAAVDGLELELQNRGQRCQVTIDGTLDDYACLVETELGQVDETIERRLEKLLEALRPDSEGP